MYVSNRGASLGAAAIMILTAGCSSLPPSGDGGVDGTGGDAAVNDAPLQDASADVVATDTPLVEAGPSRALEANDISILLPIDGANASALWAASAAGRGGPLVSREVFGQIGRPLFRERSTPEAQYDALRVVAVRYDPCFTHGVAPSEACQPQIRLVMQGVDLATGRAFDGAIHLLYNLTPALDAATRAELRAMTALAPANVGRPLGVSPVVAAQGMNGPYAQRLRVLVLASVGMENLVRMTFMTRTSARSGTWEFGGVSVRAWPGSPPPGPLSIPMLAGATLQTTTSIIGPGVQYSVTPRIGQPENVAALSTQATADAHRTGGIAAVRALLTWATGVENPATHTPDTIDCATCHVANRVARSMARDYPMAAMGLEPTVSRQIGAQEMNSENLRIFGYFDADPAIAQRAANETAQALTRVR